MTKCWGEFEGCVEWLGRQGDIIYYSINWEYMKYESMKEIMLLKGTERKILDSLMVNQNIDFIDYADECSNTALHYAVSLSYEKAITKYFQLLANPQLWEKKFNTSTTHQYIKYRVKLWINAQNIDGLTAIHYASLKGLVKVAEILENAGARLDKTTSIGLNVLTLAAQQNQIKSMLFFRGKVDVNGTDHKKCTALHWACFKGHEVIVKYLVCENQIQLNFQESQGRTALHIAVIYGYEKIVRALLLAGANRTVKDKQKKTAKDYAEQSGNKNILELLTHQSKSCCSKNSYTYQVVKKPNCSVLVVVILMLFAIIGQNYILSNESINNNSSIFSDSSPWAIQSIYVVLAQLLILSLCLTLGLYMHYSKSKIQPINFNQLKNSPQEMDEFCFWCHTNTDQGIEHCELCRQCVVLKVKHSSVVGRCIGSQNIKKYLVFLKCLLIVLIFEIIKGIRLVISVIAEDGRGDLIVPTYLMIVVDLACFVPLVNLIYHIYKNLKILLKYSEFQFRKKLSQTTLDTQTTLLINKIERYQKKMKEET